MVEGALLLSLVVLVWTYFKCRQARREVTNLKSQLSEAVHLATHDSLTGLPNRLLFHDRLEQAIVNSDREKKPAALMFMDLDKFKQVNDRFTHDAGDELLQMVSDRMRGVVRKSDTISRLGGDEFTVVLSEIDDERNAVDIAKKILKQFEEPYIVRGHSVEIGNSIGIAVYPNDALSAEDLIDCADKAMYHAKEKNLGYALCNK